jgi:hypothetical protein
MKFLNAILDHWGERIVLDLRKSYRRHKVNASGRLSRTTEARVKRQGGNATLQIIINAYGLLLEPGRGPTRKRGRGDLEAIIRRWIDQKGITPREGTKDQMARRITYSIHRRGTRAYPGRGPKVISGVVGKVKASEVEKDFADKIPDVTLDQLIDLRYARN